MKQMSEREYVNVEPGSRWYASPFVVPLFVTIITTVDEQGRINAAPFSLVSIYDTSDANPRLSVNIVDEWNTSKNIKETKEFVVNFPSYSFLEDVIETSKFFEKGVNELEHTKFTTMPSNKIKPPRIKEAFQHLECKLDFYSKPSSDTYSTIYVGKIVSASMDKEVLELKGIERIKKS